jgi:predicted Rossmann fold flavoprotein
VIKTQCSVKSIEKESDFHIVTNHGTFVAHSVVVAAGGLSFPKIGATDFGYRIARQFGLKIVPTRPSLVALVMDRKRSVSSLAGVSVDSLVTVNGHSFRENVLFTHRGMSGPAILQASNYWDRNVPIEINLLPDQNGEDLLLENSDRKEKLSNFLAKYLPGRFSEIFVDENTHDRPLNQIGRTELRAIGEVLNSWQIKFCDTEGYGRAEVTIGGISTDELSSQTMEARSVPGLYFIGEVVDVTGWLGGYNFQWAWASGYAAGQAV